MAALASAQTLSQAPPSGHPWLRNCQTCAHTGMSRPQQQRRAALACSTCSEQDISAYDKLGMTDASLLLRPLQIMSDACVKTFITGVVGHFHSIPLSRLLSSVLHLECLRFTSTSRSIHGQQS